MAYVFVVGTGRCGSSLVHELIARHREVAFLSNIDDRLSALELRGRFNNWIFRRWPPQWSRKGRLRFAPSEGYNIIGRNVSPVYVRPCRDLCAEDVTPWLARRFQSFFEDRRRAQQKPLFVHKYTGWSRIGFFAGIFPEARFLHVIRDGRAVANSWMKMSWWNGYEGPESWLWGALDPEDQNIWLESGRSFATLAGLGWNRLMRSFEHAQGDLHPMQYMQVRYEDLVEKPGEVVEQVLGFCGLEMTSDIRKVLDRGHVMVEGRDAFQRDLGDRDQERINKVIARRLVKYGYRAE